MVLPLALGIPLHLYRSHDIAVDRDRSREMTEELRCPLFKRDELRHGTTIPRDDDLLSRLADPVDEAQTRVLECRGRYFL
jgi:hypothetical protein